MSDNQTKEQKKHDFRGYHRTKMQKDLIIDKLREQGCRITKQRLTIIDIILSSECACCKEIYYKAFKYDEKIGSATVYRMINKLEEIGAISRKNMYKVAYFADSTPEEACTVILDDNTTYHLSSQKWNSVIKAGLLACDYIDKQEISKITVMQAECDYMDG